VLHQTFGILHVKAVDTTERVFVFSGMATTPTLDRQGEIIEPLGVRFRNPIPLLLHHDKTKPVGSVTLGPVRADGVPFTATIPIVDEPGIVRDRTNEAIHSVKAGLYTAVSIGWRPLGPLAAAIQHVKDGIKFLKSEILELSLVTMPANADATIDGALLAIKAFAASGDSPELGVTSASQGTRMTNQTRAERIKAFEGDRDLKLARMSAIMDEAAVEGATLDEAHTKEYDGLNAQVDSLNAQLEREKTLEKLLASAAQPVPATPGRIESSIVRVTSTLPPGTAFTRYVMAQLASKGDTYRAIEFSKRWHDSTPEVELMLKAAVAPGTTTDATWAGPLVPAVQTVAAEFVALLMPATIIGRIAGLKKVPFNTSIPIETDTGTYNWVGQGAPKPVTKLGFTSARVDAAKIAGIITITEELARNSSPAAEGVIRDAMIAGITKFTDTQFIDPAVTATAGVRPASITNGITPTAATGDPFADLAALFAKFTAANVPLGGVTLIMSTTNAMNLSMQLTVTGSPAFPSLTSAGGSITGIPVVASEVAGTNIIAVVPRYVLIADDGGVTVDVSREASLQMDSAPDNPTLATTVMVSLWQQNLVGFRAERFVSWKRALDAGVQLLTGANYPPIAP
jgi:HK97 family phage major capsid protein